MIGIKRMCQKILPLTVAFICFMPVGLTAQDGQIKGKINDSLSGQAMANVNITLLTTQYGAATSKKGEFVITNVTPGRYTLTANRVGYQRVLRQVKVEAGKILFINIEMSEQPIELSEVIVSQVMITHGNDGIEPIPGSAHFIGPKTLNRANNYDIHRVLRDIPGVNIQEEDGYGLRPNIGFRGTGVERSQRITLMEDGILAAPAPYSAPAAYYFPTAGRMHGIEVRKGSSQIKYGPNTTGGALNLISTPIPTDFQGIADFFVGANAARNIHVAIGDSYENAGFLIESYQMQVDGFKKLDSGGDTGFDKKDYLAKLRINTDSDAKYYQALSLKLGQTSEISNETYLGLTDADFGVAPNRRYAASQLDQMDAEQSQMQIRHFLQAANRIDLSTTFYRNEFKRNWFKLDKVRAEADGTFIGINDVLTDPDAHGDAYQVLTGTASSNEGLLELKNNNREYRSQGVQAAIGLELNRYGADHEFEVGLRYHQDQMDRYQWIDLYAMDNGTMKLTDAGIPGTESNRIEEADATAFYLQYKFKKGRLTAIPGWRYERITMRRRDYGKSDQGRQGTNLSARQNKINVSIPGIGVDYQFVKSISAFVGIHKGFSPPGSKEGTLPENSVNYELGLRFNHQVLFSSAILFYSDYDNLLGSDLAATGGGGTADRHNGGRVLVRGLELSLDYKMGLSSQTDYSIPLRLTYTFTEANFKSDFVSDYGPWNEVNYGDHLPYLPKHLLTIGAGFASGAWGFNVDGRYVSQMRTKAGSGPLKKNSSIDAHLVIDASLEYQLDSHNLLFVGIKNLNQARYIVSRRPAGVRPGLPRTVMGGIKTHF